MTDILLDLQQVVGPDGVISGQAAQDRAFSPWCRLGRPAAIARPRTPREVAAVLRTAGRHGMAVVPWGGGTGLVDGAFAEGALAVSLERMAAVEDLDVTEATMTVQAGCRPSAACDAAADRGLLLPLDLGSRGSATLGGMIATNAGGGRVLRYGMTRESVLGLEVVLADGETGAAGPLVNGYLSSRTGLTPVSAP